MRSCARSVRLFDPCRGGREDVRIGWADQKQRTGETYVLGVLSRSTTVEGEDLTFTRIKGTDPSRSDGDDTGTSE